MKYCLLFVLNFAPLISLAQWTDDFGDGNFTNNPSWSGDDTVFEVDVSNTLHLNGPPVSGRRYLSTQSTSIENAEWEFLVEMAFNPSSSNYTKVYIVSDAQELTSNLNGYFVKIGGAEDEVSLYKQTGASEMEIIDGIDDRVNSVSIAIRVKLTRDSIGNWALYSDNSGGTLFTPEGSVVDDTYFYSSWFGIVCVHTSTRADQFYFDDFLVSGSSYVDSIQPFIERIEINSSDQISLCFSEIVDKSSGELKSNYFVNKGISEPIVCFIDTSDGSKVHLTLGNPLEPTIEYQLNVSGIKDLFGNTMVSTHHDIVFYIAHQYDVVINEVFADPSPSIGLPEEEFIELYNRSEFTISLKDWEFSDGSTKGAIPDMAIAPDSFIILCSLPAVGAYSKYGTTFGLNNWPSLNNSGDGLILSNDSGVVIHRVTYKDDWFQNNLKRDGGWSLEMIDTENPCAGAHNWAGSSAQGGGTPGSQNSVFGENRDVLPPFLIRAVVVDSVTIKLLFNEVLDLSKGSDTNIYTIDHGIGNPKYASVDSTDQRNVLIKMPEPMVEKRIYKVTITGISDCVGNSVSGDSYALFGIPEQINPSDLVINELLFNPKLFCSDFVELYNRTNKIIDLEGLYVANLGEGDSLYQVEIISNEGYLVFPQQYIVLSEDIASISRGYMTNNFYSFIEVSDMPSFPDKEGAVILLSNSGERIDQVSYNEDMHFDLMDNVEGVSLERIHFDKPSQDEDNWHSASSTVGYATPGYQNSQFSNFLFGSGTITVEPIVFSPDNDGYRDFVKIHYLFKKHGYTATVSIYDIKGRWIRTLVNNELLGISGTYVWDGLTNEGNKARMGMYIIYFEAFDLEGKMVKTKKTCVLGGPYN